MCEEEAVGAQGRKLSDPRPTRNWLRKAEEGSRSIRWQGKRWSRCSTHQRLRVCASASHPDPPPYRPCLGWEAKLHYSNSEQGERDRQREREREREAQNTVQCASQKYDSQKYCWKESMYLLIRSDRSWGRTLICVSLMLPLWSEPNQPSCISCLLSCKAVTLLGQYSLSKHWILKPLKFWCGQGSCYHFYDLKNVLLNQVVTTQMEILTQDYKCLICKENVVVVMAA